MLSTVRQLLATLAMKRATTPEWCEQAIVHWFGPLASEMSLKLVRVNDHLYEMVSSRFTLRIWFGKPPWRDYDFQEACSVTLVPNDERRANWGDTEGEIGICAIASFYGESCQGQYVHDRLAFWREAEKSSVLARKYCRKLLLGTSDDFSKIRAHVDSNIRREQTKIREMLKNLPPNVKRMWRMKGESDADWRERVKRGEETPMPDMEDRE